MEIRVTKRREIIEIGFRTRTENKPAETDRVADDHEIVVRFCSIRFFRHVTTQLGTRLTYFRTLPPTVMPSNFELFFNSGRVGLGLRTGAFLRN